MYLKNKPSTSLNLQTFVRLASKAIDEDVSREIGCPVPADIKSFFFSGWLAYEDVECELDHLLDQWDVMEINHSADYPAEGEF